ncbi:MAG: tetratricopeptide repeat protein [Planctomycetes bacterium]|nr:tetratricopeptide repeat protein [Planctomycetota bacterium]NUQ35498.1 tetratricopeptide repeat protein [Planctomycetaceae bacterium]
MPSLQRALLRFGCIALALICFAPGLMAANKVVYNAIDKALKNSATNDKPVFAFVDSESSMMNSAPSRFQGFVKALQTNDELFKAVSTFELSQIDLWDPVSETQLNTALQMKYGDIGTLLAFIPGGTKAFWKGGVTYADTATVDEIAKEMTTHLKTASDAVEKWKTGRDEILKKYEAKAANDAAFQKNAEGQLELARHFGAAYAPTKAKECFERAIKALKAKDAKDPQIEGLSIEQAQVAFDSTDYTLAMNLYQTFAKTFKESERVGEALLQAAQCQIELGKPADAKTTLKGIIANKKLDEGVREDAQMKLDELNEKR